MLAALFEWRRTRGDRGVVHVDMRTQRWEVVRIGLHYLYTDAHLGIFRHTDVGHTLDQFLDLVLDVLQLADELLLTRLQSLCLVLLRARLKATNVAALLADARRLNAPALAEVCMDYITRNLETLLESGFLDDLPLADMHALEAYVQHRQDVYGHRTIASDRLLALLLKHQAYVEALDLPKPSLGLACLKVPRRAKTSPALLPADRRTPEPARAPPRRRTHQRPRQATTRSCLRWTTSTSAGSVLADRRQAAHARRTDAAQVAGARAERRVARRVAAHATGRVAARTHADRRVCAAGAARRRAGGGAADVLRAPPAPSVSLETQEALARLPLTARVSQKERKKQRAPEPAAPSAPPPAWGRAARATPSPASIAWGPGAASPPAPYVSPPTLSFAQIQQQQRTEGLRAQVAMQTPTSFAQIQHEERLAAERRRQEQQDAEAFERWFEEESRRVQQEQRAPNARRAADDPTRGRGAPRRPRRAGERTRRQGARSRDRADRRRIDVH
ncbi:hypothetical protein CBS14141_000017 [Malassezia furfur]|nr:hypothetical protein CBS14141_000017 [Malassezia furfur]